MIRIILFVVAIGWAVLNVGGSAWALVQSEPVHAGVHFIVACAFAAGAFFLRPRRRTDTPAPVVAELEDEISELQRKLNEKQASLEFTEQLLAKRPVPRAVDDSERPS
jgi:hypothetical protein